MRRAQRSRHLSTPCSNERYAINRLGPDLGSEQTPRPPTAHIAIFARALSGGGGVERVVLQLAGALAERGHRVDLVLARSKGRFLQELPASVNLVDLRAPIAVGAIPKLAILPSVLKALLPAMLTPGVAQVLGAIPALSTYLEDERPDVLLAALDYANITAIAARQLAASDTRIVVSVHNHMSSAVANAERSHLRRVISLARRFYPAADAIVCVSDGVANDLADLTALPRSKFATIYNPVITEQLSELAKHDPEHRWFNDDSVPVILAVGKLRRQKDFGTLIKAFARLRAVRHARLVVLGEGPERAALAGLIQDYGVADDVELAGFKSNPYAFMARASVFVLSSAWEGFGNVLVEAMACRCPVVSTDCPSGPAEILAGGRFGVLVPVADDEALANAIDAQLTRPLDIRAAAARAHEFTSAISAAEYEKLLLPTRLA